MTIDARVGAGSLFVAQPDHRVVVVSPRRLVASPWVPMALTALAAVLVLASRRVPIGDITVYAGYIGLGVALPGVFTWRLLLRRLHGDDARRPTWLEDLSLGTILGFGLQLPVFLLGVAVGVPLLVLLVPVLALALSATPLGRAVWRLPTARMDPRASWCLAGICVYGLAWLRHNVFPLRPLWLPANRTPSTDETFHQALIADVGSRFPPEIPFLLDTRLEYHWFVHAQIATSRHVTGIESVVALRLLLPVLTLLLIVAGLAAVALRVSERPVAAVIAPALLVAGVFHVLGTDFPTRDFLEPFLSPRYVSSPSQTYGVMVSLPAVMLILETLRPEQRSSRGTWVALGLTLLLLSGSKATFLPIFLCGAVAAWGVRLMVQRRVDPAASGLVALLVLATMFAQLVIFGSNTGALNLDPFKTVTVTEREHVATSTPLTWAGMLATMLTAWLLYGAGVVGLLLRRRALDGRVVFLLVCVSAGVVVPLLFHRTGLSQLWFLRSVAELLVLLSAWGLSCLLPNPLTARPALRLVGTAAVAGLTAWTVSSFVAVATPEYQASLTGLILTPLIPLLVVGVWLALRRLTARQSGQRRRPGATVVLAILLGLGTTNAFQLAWGTLGNGGLDAADPDELFAQGGVTAAQYVDRHAAVDDVVATNMHCRQPGTPRCDNRHFWVSAYTQRRVVIEGWGYSAPTNKSAVGGGGLTKYTPAPFPERLAVNDAVFLDPSEENLARLVDTYSVYWLVVGKTYRADVPGLRRLASLKRVFSNDAYVVFRVR